MVAPIRLEFTFYDCLYGYWSPGVVLLRTTLSVFT